MSTALAGHDKIRSMQVMDFSFEPFVEVCEKDITITSSSTVEIRECRNPAQDYWIFLSLIIVFSFVVYKIACRIKR